MNSRERVLTALRIEQPDRVPYVESRVDPAVQRVLLGQTNSFPEEVSSVTNLDILSSPALNEVMGLDNLQLRFLPPIFAEYQRVDGVATPVTPLIRTRDDLDKMVFPDPGDPNLYQQASEIIERNRGKYAVGASLRTGVSATHMSMGLDGIAYALADDPGLVTTVLGRYADWTIAVIRHLKDIGVDFVWTFDDIAYKTGPMVSPKMFRTVFVPHMKRVADAIKSEGFPWILHSDGNLMPLMDDLLSLGINGLHPLEPGAMDIEQVKQLYGDRLCLIGNIDLHYTLTRGTPKEVEAEVKSRIEKIGKGGGYMISSANSVTFYCKIENVRAMIRAIQEYSPYKTLC
jgi:uroporphyrinogen decarboxylase